MTNQEERERALALVCENATATAKEWREDLQDGMLHVGADFLDGSVDLLRDCIPVERADYDRLRRALWSMMRSNGYPISCYSSSSMRLAGFQSDECDWTPAAHEFARAMREKGGEGA